ncbi:MAG: HAD-IIIA family hydrolase [Deltaproteobacteria bacterium]|nr:HAD-IIIA family hydrolase [Deltaproteobacteria bacterium]
MAEVIILDRDGVLNTIVVDPEHGTIDSPLHPTQVTLLPGVPEALLTLNHLGFALAIATNQPSAAKGKTTEKNLRDTHARVLELAQAAGARILSNQLCLHRSEDGCACRKPQPKMLLDALRDLGADPTHAWMVGDGVTDVEAGQRAGTRTAFLGPRKCDACKIFDGHSAAPTVWCADLPAFVRHLEASRPPRP